MNIIIDYILKTELPKLVRPCVRPWYYRDGNLFAALPAALQKYAFYQYGSVTASGVSCATLEPDGDWFGLCQSFPCP